MAYALAASVCGENLSKIMGVVDALDELRGSTHNGLPLADVQTLDGTDLYFETGSQDELDRLMKLFILTEPDIESHGDEDVVIYAAMEDDAPSLGDEYYYSSERLKELTEIALSENHPVGWRWEYNDGAYYQRSGYDRQAEIISWHIEDVIEQTSAREKMSARRELREYLKARGPGIAKFDALGKGKTLQ